jgi:hypothetical protein
MGRPRPDGRSSVRVFARASALDPEETFTTGRFPASEITRACASRDAAGTYLRRPLTTHADLAYRSVLVYKLIDNLAPRVWEDPLQ